MARAKKPGTPGKTTIPAEVVKDATRRIRKEYEGTGGAAIADLEVIAQQRYLYFETIERPRAILPGLIAARFGQKRGTRRTPLGRAAWTGDPELWNLQLYKWSDECWDEHNDACTIGGTPEECIRQAVAGW